MKVFVLEDDDDRNRAFEKALQGHAVTFAKTAADGISAVKHHGPFDLYLLDHDLGDRVYVPTTDENTGSAFLRDPAVLDQMGGKVVFVHSHNTVAAKSMELTLADARAYVNRWPFSWDLLSLLKKG